MSLKELVDTIWGDNGIVKEAEQEEVAQAQAISALGQGFDETIVKEAQKLGYKAPEKKAEAKTEEEKKAGPDFTNLNFGDVVDILNKRFGGNMSKEASEGVVDKFAKLLTLKTATPAEEKPTSATDKFAAYVKAEMSSKGYKKKKKTAAELLGSMLGKQGN